MSNVTENEQTNNILKIRVKITRIQIKDNNKVINEFNAYKVLNKQKKWVDLRFTKDVKNTPDLDKNKTQQECYIYVHSDNINYTENYRYPRFWVRRIEKIEPIETPKQNITEYFDEDDIPF